MSVWDTIKKAFSLRRAGTTSETVDDIDKAMDAEIEGVRSIAGANVTEDSSLALSAVYACVKVLSESVASLPLHIYKRLPDGVSKERATNFYLYPILHGNPNDDMTSSEFWETMMVSLTLWGNSYAKIEWDNGGRVKALWPLLPGRMRPRRTEDGKLWYFYHKEAMPEIYPKREIYHARLLSKDGIVGMSPIAQHREVLGLSLAAQEFGARFFGQGTHPGGIAEHPGHLTPEAHTNLETSLAKGISGLGRSHRLLLLEEGMKYTQIGIPPEDAQFLQTREFQVIEICRIFRVQPHKIMHLLQATFSNIEHQGIEFRTDSIGPHLVRFEQRLNKSLLLPGFDKDYFCEFLAEGLLRGDTAARYTAYTQGRQWGWLSADDVRALENMNPLPDGTGKIYMMPMNMIPAEAAGAGFNMPGPARSGKEIQAQIDQVLPGAKEIRARRSAAGRRRMVTSYHKLFADAVAKVVKREQNDVMKAAKKHLGERSSADFDLWLEDEYREILDYYKKRLKPVTWNYAEEVQAAVAAELGTEPVMTSVMERFLGVYFAAAATRYIGSSLGQIKQIVREELAADKNPMAALDQRFTEWSETRPDKVADNETVREGNAVARQSYREEGVTHLRWVNTGSNSCPYCEELDGVIVGIEDSFVPADQDFQPEGADHPLRSGSDTFHPPLHGGCVCTIVAG